MSDQVVDLPEGPLQISVYGRKGQGKTEWAWMVWDSWEGDRLLVDPNNDCLKNHPDDVPLPLTDEMLIGGWPEYLRTDDERTGQPERMSLRYVPGGDDDKTYRENLDRVVGLAFSHPGILLWVDEFSEVAAVHKVLPHTRRVLRMGRHVPMWLLTTDIRPIGVDPLGLAQADVVVMFQVPNPDDRKRLCSAIGWGDRAEFDAEMDALGDHCYLRYVAKDHELSVWPPLPLEKTSRRRLAAAQMEEEIERPALPSSPS